MRYLPPTRAPHVVLVGIMLVGFCACEEADHILIEQSTVALGEADGEAPAEPIEAPRDEPLPIRERAAVEPERRSPPRYISTQRLRTLLDRGESLAVVRVLADDRRIHTWMQDGISFHAYRGTARLQLERHLSGPALPDEFEIGYPLTHYSVDVEVGCSYLLPFAPDPTSGYVVPYRHGDVATRLLRVEAGRLPAADMAVEAVAVREGQ